jgi:hypothetical protein
MGEAVRRAGRGRGPWTLLALLSVVLVVTGCSSTPSRTATRTPSGGASGPLGMAGSSTGSATSASGSAATAGLTGSAGAGSNPGLACTAMVGSVLRERTAAGPDGTVTLLAGALPCRWVGVWVSSFTLNEDSAGDPTPRFLGRYTGAKALSARLSSVSGTCTAAAVYFSVTAGDADDTSAAATTAVQARADLAYWPAGQQSTVPTGAILRGRVSVLLAGSVSGDPSRCSPGEDVSTPVAAAGDCWLAAGGGSGTKFTSTSCDAAHTHEVYWAETLLPQLYAQQGKPQGISPSAWARNRADDVCAAKRGAIALAHDVRMSDIALEFLWPSGLDYPPDPADGWAHAQLVCLARWQDGKPSDRHLLHR